MERLPSVESEESVPGVRFVRRTTDPVTWLTTCYKCHNLRLAALEVSLSQPFGHGFAIGQDS